MPEGPECTREASNQHEYWSGKELTDVKVYSGRYQNKPEPVQEIRNVLPLKVLGVRNRGKFIWWSLRDDDFNIFYFFQSLGMSGRWTDEKHIEDTEYYKDIRYAFLSSKTKGTFYLDRRNFGTLKLVTDPALLDAKLASLGPDVLSAEWLTLDKFQERFREKKNGQKTLAQLLMNQSVISGIGNYLKSEILWVSELSPHRTPDSLEDEEWKALWRNCHFIPCESAWRGSGSSVLTYLSQEKGNEARIDTIIRFQAGYNPENGNLAVYRREKDPLGNKVIREETADKRTTHWCPSVQK
jgi:endonuclease-8